MQFKTCMPVVAILAQDTASDINLKFKISVGLCRWTNSKWTRRQQSSQVSRTCKTLAHGLGSRMHCGTRSKTRLAELLWRASRSSCKIVNSRVQWMMLYLPLQRPPRSFQQWSVLSKGLIARDLFLYFGWLVFYAGHPPMAPSRKPDLDSGPSAHSRLHSLWAAWQTVEAFADLLGAEAERARRVGEDSTVWGQMAAINGKRCYKTWRATMLL